MARKAQAITYLKTAPKDLPDGVVQVEVRRKLKSEKPENAPDSWSQTADQRVLTLNVPAPNAEGVIAFAGFLSEAYGIDGPLFCAEAIRNAMADRAGAKIVLGREGDSLRFVPTISPLRTVDKGELVGARLAEWTNEHPGQMPSAEVLKNLYAGIA